MSIHDRARAALSKARKEGRRIYFLIKVGVYDDGAPIYCGITRKEYKEGQDAYVQTWVDGDFRNTNKIEKI